MDGQKKHHSGRRVETVMRNSLLHRIKRVAAASSEGFDFSSATSWCPKWWVACGLIHNLGRASAIKASTAVSLLYFAHSPACYYIFTVFRIFETFFIVKLSLCISGSGGGSCPRRRLRCVGFVALSVPYQFLLHILWFDKFLAILDWLRKLKYFEYWLMGYFLKMQLM